MDIKGRILELMNERGWSRYRLSRECGVCITTVNAWFNKNNYNPRLDTLESICNAFEIPLIEFFSGIDESNLTAEQLIFLQKFNKLPDAWRKEIIELMDLRLSENKK